MDGVSYNPLVRYQRNKTMDLMRRDSQANGHGAVEMDLSETTFVATSAFQDRPRLEKGTSTVPWLSLARKVYSTRSVQLSFHIS